MPPTPSSGGPAPSTAWAARSIARARTPATPLPPNLLTTLDNVVMSETTYAYKPLVFDHFMKRLGASSSSPGTYTLAETIFLKPRNGQVNMQQPDNTPCPTP